MKLSEMTNDQAVDTLVRLSAPIANLCDDEQITDMLKQYQEMEETPIINVIGKFLPEITACAFKKHRDDVMEIVGALTLQSKEEAAKMNFLETIKVVKECLNDGDLKDFFTSFKPQTKKTGRKSAQG